jgi:voltage-gated potassium channel
MLQFFNRKEDSHKSKIELQKKWYKKEVLKITYSLIILSFIFFGGTFGYYLFGEGEWSLVDCAYMTFITLSTIGYSETFDLSNRPEVRIYTMFIIVFGLGAFAYYFSHLVSYIVEGDLKNFFWNKKMIKNSAKLSNHIIVCGAGKTGVNVVEELVASKKQVVVIESREEIIEHLKHELDDDIPIILGDATDDDVLINAGIKNAYGLISSLPDDKDNIYVVITAKSLNPDLKIVTKSIDPKTVKKFYSIGADYVVSSKQIGGVRMATQMTSPVAVSFIEALVSHKDNKHTIDALVVSENSHIVGKKLGEINLRQHTKALILAFKEEQTNNYNLLPSSSTIFKKNMELIILASIDEFEKLNNYINGEN